MAWMKRLAETYDLYQDLAGIVKDGQPVLLPVSHSTINAQIEVTLNEAGEFVMGKVVEKGDEVTIIPINVNRFRTFVAKKNLIYLFTYKTIFLPGNIPFYLN